MKNIVTFMAFLLGMGVCTFLFNISSCTREDAIVGEIDPPQYDYGTVVLKSSAGWNFDKAHSNVEWETAYLGVGALLTGRFNAFSTTINFDEGNPENTTFSGYVVLSSVNTGEPGRDAGCLLNTFGVTTLGDTAKLTSKQVIFDNAGGYDTMVELDFHGVKKIIPMKLHFTGVTPITANNPYSLAGFDGQFEFKAKTDFGIVSNNIADRVVVKMNLAFKKPN